MTEAGSLSTFSWRALSGGNETAQGQAAQEARELARALAAHNVVTDKEAVALDLEDRIEAFYGTIWPTQPLDGYGLHSSLGAYLVAKVAVGLVPSARVGLRHDPLRARGLVHALAEHGVGEPTALSMLGAWSAVEPDFKGSDQGLTTSQLAGLAERTLTKGERDRCLAQVACSPRCLARLASAAALLHAVRTLLPVLPPDELGTPFLAMTAALALGRPERALELDTAKKKSPGVLALRELALAQMTLARADRPNLNDSGLAIPPSAPPKAPKEGELDDGGTTQVFNHSFFKEQAQQSEDVLDIVEERSDPESGGKRAALYPATPRPARWSEAARLLDDELLRFAADRLSRSGLVGKKRSLLGLTPFPPGPTVLPIPTPPDEPTLSNDAKAGLEALFAPVRAALRSVVLAAEGRPPMAAAIEAAGDLSWALRRAEALALVVRGELVPAKKAIADFPEGAAPEGRWAADRLLRFGAREAQTIGPEEARPMASALVADLLHQLGRTIAGTIPGDEVKRA